MKIGEKKIINFGDLMAHFKGDGEECRQLLISGELQRWLAAHGHEALAERLVLPVSHGEIPTCVRFMIEEYLFSSNQVVLPLDTSMASNDLAGSVGMRVHVFIAPEAARISDLDEKQCKFVQRWVNEMATLNRKSFSPSEPLVQMWWRSKANQRPYHLINGEDGDYTHRIIPNDPGITTVDYFDNFWKLSRVANGCWIPASILKDKADGDRMEMLWPVMAYNPVDRIMNVVPPQTKTVILRLVMTLDQPSAGFGRRYRNFTKTFHTALNELPMTGPLLGVGHRGDE